ncbi:MAG: DUF364 domain-containing protein [Chloroflexota bacterium]
MALIDKLLANLQDGKIEQVLIGLHWTMVVADIDGERRGGLASTLNSPHEHHGEPDVPLAGQLTSLPGLEVAAMACSDRQALRSVGVAAINALLPLLPQTWRDVNAEQVIAAHGEDKTVVLVGHFPFTPRLRARVGELIVLERQPSLGDLPETAAIDVVPTAQVVAITGMTFLNHTLEALLELCSPQAKVILLGPSTPLSPLLFDYRIDVLCGSVVTDIPAVLRAVGEGANFRQAHRAGVRLVSMARPD